MIIDTDLDHTSPNATPPCRLFAINGRMGRLSFQAAQLLFDLMLGLTAILIWALGTYFTLRFDGDTGDSRDTFWIATVLLTALPLAAMVGTRIVFNVRRLQDLNRHSRWLLLPIGMISLGVGLEYYDFPLLAKLSQIITLLYYLYVSCAPGTVGANRYGAPRPTKPRERPLGKIGSIYSLLYMTVFVVCTSVFTMALPSALMLGGIQVSGIVVSITHLEPHSQSVPDSPRRDRFD
jgi:uncharacterized membrane protein YhaH (DUF805 family)